MYNTIKSIKKASPQCFCDSSQITNSNHPQITKNSTIFKTYETDLDGISNKLGFSKRSFAEWGKQVKKSFNEAGGGIKGFTNALSTAFTVPIEKDNGWIKNSIGKIVTKENIDSFIPKLDTNSARGELETLQNIQNKINETKGSWDDYNNQFQYGRKYLLDYAKQNNVLESSVDNVKEANQAARQSAIDHNAALQKQTLGAKAAAAGMNLLKTALNSIAYMAIIQAVISFANTIITKFDDIVNAYQNGIDKIKD